MAKEKKKKSVLGTILKVLGIIILLVALVLGLAVLYHKLVKAPEIPATATNTTGLVQAIGKGLYDKDGNEVVLQGVNAGTLFVTEGWLAPYSIAEAENGEYPVLSEEQFLAGFFSNPNLTEDQVYELLNIYYDNWFTKEDVKTIADMGFNCLRIPFYWRNLMDEVLTSGAPHDSNLKVSYVRKSEEEAFKRLDQILSSCKEYGVYVILDFHGAPASQNGYEHSGAMEFDKTENTIKLWTDETAINATIDLWKFVAEHYKDSELADIIAAYDLLNEPRSKGLSTDKTCWEVYDRIYDAIRETGDNHVLAMEGCWDFSALPNPEKYGWENVMYSYHWYNWVSSWLPDVFFYAYQDLRNIGRNYDVPVFIGEFTYFENQDNWNKGLDLFAERHYSWTIWTYKMSVYGWWSNSWGLYNLNFWEGADYQFSRKANVKTDDYEYIKSVFEWVTTDHASTSNTYKYLQEYMAK